MESQTFVSDEDNDTRFGTILFSILKAGTVALNQATVRDSSIRVQLELRVEIRVATLTLTESQGERAHVCAMVVTIYDSAMVVTLYEMVGFTDSMPQVCYDA